MNRTFARIIVEQQSAEHWSAWFADTPQQAVGGTYASEAISRLLTLFGGDGYEIDEMFAIDESTTVTHMEFRIPHRSLQLIPRPSTN